MKKFILLTAALFGQLLILNAQTLKEAAQQSFSNQDWKAAAKNYQKYLKTNDADSSAWYNLAISKARLQEYDQAIEYLKEAKERNFPSQFVYFGICKANAQKKDELGLISAMEDGAANGLATYALLKSDEAFAPYQESELFQEALKRVELNAYPCLSGENYRHFDFWLGEWDVYANGAKVGVNSITRATGGCAIHESYTTARNYAGQSINFYDPIDKKWHQHWVGSSGDTYNYLETKRGPGMLQFESKAMGPQGNISLSRLTFTLNEDGTVRQLFESSTDEGKTWTAAFDGLYKKRE